MCEDPAQRFTRVNECAAAALVALAGWKTTAGGAKRGEVEGGGGATRADAAVTAVVDAAPPPLRCPEDMVLIPAGRFWMGTEGDGGNADERPRHEVRLEAFCIDRMEVTVARYRACVQAGVCTAATTVNWECIDGAGHRTYDRYCNARYADRDDHPMNCIDWSQAKTFCEWTGHTEGARRLLREAEWENAVRVRAAARIGDTPTVRRDIVGARCASGAQR